MGSYGIAKGHVQSLGGSQIPEHSDSISGLRLAISLNKSANEEEESQEYD